MSNNELAKQLLDEYGQAIRGDWSQLDGRYVQNDLDSISNLIDNKTKANLKLLRKELELCPIGGGHWTDHCEMYHGKEKPNE